MSMDSSAAFRAASPANSGRDSPALRVSRQRDLLDHGVNPKDKAYRRYALGVERALASFDTTEQEWADYISFLARLLKALQAHPEQFQVIPESQSVATHLAQCLNPTLPSGVHQKALEVYNYIFEYIGKSNLERDLYLYLPGLVPVLSFASLSVRPIFAKLLEAHILSLDAAALRSPLKAIVLALLPGLEDEASEDFETWIGLFDKLRKASCLEPVEHDTSTQVTTDSYFWQCFFLATITNPSRRQGALSYLTRELPKYGEVADSKVSKSTLSPEARATLSPEPGLLIRCLAAGLADEQLLVQRGFLDVLVTQLPLNSVVLQQMVPVADLDRLIYAAIGVVARRDMSLNRRLWSWLLGPESTEESDPNITSPSLKSPEAMPKQANYFARYGLQSLVRSLKAMFINSVTASERSRPFRLCLSLMDRWEVGGLLIPDIFVPAMRNAFEISERAKKGEAEEVVKSASNFFDGIESGLIWTKFNQLVSNALTDPSKSGDLSLCLFIVSRFNIREEEMIMRHIPLSSLFLLAHLGKSSISEEARIVALDILERLISLIPARSFTGPDEITQKLKSQRSEMLKSISSFYTDHHGGLDGTIPPYSPTLLGQIIFRESLGLLLELFTKSPTSPAIDSLTRVVYGLVHKVPDAYEMIAQLGVFDSLSELLETDKNTSFRVIASTTAFLVACHSSSPSCVLSTNLQNLVIHHLWQHLRPFNPKNHVEAVRCLWQIEDLSPKQKVVEAAITAFIASSLEESTSADAARQFAVFWTHSTQERILPADKGQKGNVRRVNSAIGGLGQSVIPPDPSNVLSRPLLFLLDFLTEEGTELSAFMKVWIQENPSLSRVFHILIARIQSLSCMSFSHEATQNGTRHSTKKVHSAPRLFSHDDSKECLYYMKHLLNIFQFASAHTWVVIAGEMAEGDDESQSTLQIVLIQLALQILDVHTFSKNAPTHIIDLHRVSLEVILSILENQFSGPLKTLNLENILLQKLHSNLSTMNHLLQPLLLESTTAALRLKANQSTPVGPLPTSSGFRKLSREVVNLPSKGAHTLQPPPKDALVPEKLQVPKLLIDCIKLGFQTKSARLVIDSWVAFLADVLPLYADSIFENLIPLVECLCSQIALAFGQLRSIYQQTVTTEQPPPEPFLLGLLNALENLLATAHEQLVSEEGRTQQPRSPDQPQSFFGTMVQGVFSGETGQQPGRQSTANSRLTVLLCFQDSVRACFTIWSWGIYENSASATYTGTSAAAEKPDPSSIASYGYTALRVRHRARRLLEHLFALEALECMETLATLWCRPESDEYKPPSVLGVLNVLSGSRPRHTIPAIFNSIYSRTNPSALEPIRQSSLSSELSEGDLVTFLLAYSKTVDDDAMDEIWTDCVTFVKDVLSNPLPHSQILPSLLIFLAILAEKSEGTNFGEQRRTRRELGDLFLRLLAATFTTKPTVMLLDAGEKKNQKGNFGLDVFSALAQVIPQLRVILPEQDRLQNAVNSITASVTGPAIRAKAFPANIDGRFVNVLEQLTKIPQVNKFWKKDVMDAFNDSKFFSMNLGTVRQGWLNVLREYVGSGADPEQRFLEVVNRLSAPTTAGIVFGVGATAARALEDTRTGGNLRRLAVLLLACPVDAFTRHFPLLMTKIRDLLGATSTSSPSSGTRADVYLTIRALVLRCTGVQLGSLWGFVASDLVGAMTSVLPREDTEGGEKYNNAAVVQACKLLDELVALNEDEWQLHEWLFVTDTIDAVYAPSGFTTRVAAVDAIAEALSTLAVEQDSEEDTEREREKAKRERAASLSGPSSDNLRKPILPGILNQVGLDAADLRAMQKEDLAVKVLRPFFGQLSLTAFEETYGMRKADVTGCMQWVLRDLFEGGDELMERS